jgi:hypothetical protein
MRIHAFSDARRGSVTTVRSADYFDRPFQEVRMRHKLRLCWLRRGLASMLRHTPRPFKGVQLMTMRYVGEQGLGLSEEQ